MARIWREFFLHTWDLLKKKYQLFSVSYGGCGIENFRKICICKYLYIYIHTPRYEITFNPMVKRSEKPHTLPTTNIAPEKWLLGN